jgi:hypothetical protein
LVNARSSARRARATVGCRTLTRVLGRKRNTVGLPLSREQEQALTAAVQRSLGHPFEVRFAFTEGALARGPSGKFEEFVSKLR